MKAAPFAYHRPDTVDDAVALLGEYGDDAKILAGGQSLVPMLAMRLTHFENLVDISRVDELRNIDRRDERSVDRRGNAARPGRHGRRGGRIGSAADPVHPAHRALSDPHPRNARRRDRACRSRRGIRCGRGRPGRHHRGRLSPGAPQIPASEFFTGLWETSLQSDEILTAVGFPVWSGRCGFSVQEFARRHGDFAIAGATVAVELDDQDIVTRCGIGLLGLGSTPERGTPAEEAIVGRPVTDITADDLGRLAVSRLNDVPADLQGTASYRTRVGATMVARAWTEATTEALNA